ncbi:endonuclease NucS domain-containing protein [Lysobacter silvisoli]|uniref:DUF91 domain-containing protein n=1 Tax=Lysobacter silvisoli TaxID=2293254 RepID=A0A371K732_9GAMM|nr:endonuclease NucS domain-containing protein [Lysobacter silvisoli]RDZ29662.1 DUF91 domain-containing protein [Lysobacter silvisoli]
MPIRHAIWTVGETPQLLTSSRLPSENFLEEMILKRPDILSGEWMIIGRQEHTGFGGRIDLLAIEPDASLVLIELKRDRTPREVVAQALDYAAWVDQLTPERIAQIYQRYSKGRDLAQDFKARFGGDLDEDSLNQSHQIILVAAELDDSTERIINYLNARDVAINVIFFRVFQNGGQQLLSRAWLIDPSETQANAATVTGARASGEREPWNGEFYVSYGGDRSWEDASRYGFISAGGGSWYSQTLKLLSPGDRVWVKIPKTGYVGVGRVREPSQPIRDLVFDTPEGPRGATEVLEDGERFAQWADDPENAEYAVTVDWLDRVSAARAFNELGLFGNQNTVCQPTTPKWRHTVERLKNVFTNWDAVVGSR